MMLQITTLGAEVLWGTASIFYATYMLGKKVFYRWMDEYLENNQAVKKAMKIKQNKDL